MDMFDYQLALLLHDVKETVTQNHTGAFQEALKLSGKFHIDAYPVPYVHTILPLHIIDLPVGVFRQPVAIQLFTCKEMCSIGLLDLN